MPLSFSHLAPHLQLSAIKKLELKDYIHFKKCSQRSLSISNALKSKLPLYISELMISREGYFSREFPLGMTAVTEDGKKRFRFLLEKISTSNCRIISARVYFIDELTLTETYLEISKQLKANHINTTDLECISHSDFVINLSIFNEIIKILQLKRLKLTGLQTMSFSDYQHLPEFSTLEKLVFGGTVPFDLLSTLRVKDLELRCVQEHLTPEVMNAYLKNPAAQHLLLNISHDQFEEESDHILLKDLASTQIWRVPKLEGWMAPPTDPKMMPCRAYVLSNGGNHLLVNLGGGDSHYFKMDRLADGTVEELQRQGMEKLEANWKKLS